MNCILKIIKYWFKPKCVVMKGIQINNVALMFIGYNPQYSTDDFGVKTVKFSNHKSEFYVSNIYRRIWTLKSLCKWRRLIGKDLSCIRILRLSHERVKR